MQRATFLSLIGSLAVPNISIFAKELTLTEQYKRTTQEQKALIRWIYEEGKQYGLGKTLVVIAWKESSFGIQRKNNTGEWSGGCFGISFYHTAMRYYKTSNPSPKQIAFCAEKIRTDDSFALKQAIIHLREGIKKFGNDWMKIWAFYNGGYKYWNSDEAKMYAEDFLKKIKVINKVGIL